MLQPNDRAHEFLLDVAQPTRGSVLLDLGCGRGSTMRAAGIRWDDILLVGIDVSMAQLVEAAETIGHPGTAFGLILAELNLPLPIGDGSVDTIVCHNTLEYLKDPGLLLREAARILRPGGRAVWSHVDFAGIVLNTTDVVLNRRVLENHATFVPKWMRHADGYIGRRLPGMVRVSPLHLERVDVHLTVDVEFGADARWRVDQILDVLRPAAEQRKIEMTPDELAAWLADLEAAATTGSFFFAEPTVVACSRRPWA